jgi:Cytochrome c554 and c-prime
VQERLLVLRAIVIRVAILLLGGITLVCAIRPQQPARTGPGAGSSATEKRVHGRRDFVGDGACQECHQKIVGTYLRTNHHLTSQLPSKESIAGKFTAGENILKTRDPDLHFRMDAKASGFYETAVFWQPPNQKTRTERIDFVTGSGEKGQTYLYWQGNQLFQLPVSYWTALNEWVNSPGFTDGSADFERPIVPRCLECHATYFAAVSSATAENVYRKGGYELGISCERCHGGTRTCGKADDESCMQQSGDEPSAAETGLPRER